ncbi:glycosyltransferase family 4 protein [Photobacterium sp. CCB-ST2H9]|uniref:glycosyltransferase family 4 protein n=1 Tax=Photobacterium sp. CCB-ST2H9 TaxID=2912855 RepID=UPI00200423BD|nr:glycosyltransferase family 4 protein [Photobacterium sp. CCB-ST2H9]UTM59941.1 glycosyltransferase family 4 protein [Photobacterium sp. CCB-ST2H9]
MKILYHHRVASKDGQFVHIEAILDAFAQQGHEIILVAPAVSEQASFGADGGWVSQLRRNLPRVLCELLELGYSAYDFFRLCRAILKHRPDAIYERYNLFLPSGVIAGKVFHLPLILEINAPLFKERCQYGGLSFTWLARWSEVFTWRNADHTLPVTHVLAGDVRRAGVPDERITVIPNGVDTILFHPSTNPKHPDFAGHLVVGFVGFCREWHQLDHVLALIAQANRHRHPDELPIKLLIVGDGPVLNDLRQQAKALQAEQQIHIVGLASRDTMPDWLAQIDIAIQPAVTPWCSPLKLIEYLACGKAIVAPNSDNIRELLTDGENALLFQEGKLNEMLTCIERLISDTPLRRSLSNQAAKTIDQRKLTWQHNGERIISIFHQLLEQEKTP